VKDLLQVNNLHIEFATQAGPIKAVNGVSFRIPAGKTVAIVGESGSGKSVSSQAVMGILPRAGRVTSGEILFDMGTPTSSAYHGLSGVVDLAQLNPDSAAFRSIRGDRISMIFQEPMTSLSPLHTIGDQISEALLLHRNIDKPAGRELSVDMLRMVSFPDPKAAFDTYPFELSGGLRQRAMIAMALVCRPSLLVADEPSTALDVTIQAQILKLMRDLQSELGMAIMLITHDLGVVANVADEVAVMYHGRIMERGPIDQIFSHPEHPYLKALLGAVPHFDMKEGERLVPLREISLETGDCLNKAREQATKTAAPEGVPLLDVRGITKTFTTKKGTSWFKRAASATVKAVDNVSFQVKRGECLGLVGESGCGKTTLSKVIMRAIDSDEGEVLFCGGQDKAPVNLLSLHDNELVKIRPQIQYVFQDPFSSLNPRMSVFEILVEPLLIHGIGDADYRRRMAMELMTLVGLDPRFLNRYPHSFSGGQRQRIGIARSLALQPELILCDEPVSALDVSVQAQILNLMKDLQKELGLTYIFVSHNLAVVDYIADRIAVMCAGRLVELAPREQLFHRPSHPYTQALLAAVPYPDPNRKLNFELVMEEKTSNPLLWPDPFGGRNGREPDLIEIGPGHFVRAFEPPKDAAA